MRKKILLVAIAMLALMVLTLFAVVLFPRQDDNLFFKVAIWRYQYGGGVHVHYFVVESNGTFTSYYGVPRNHDNIARRNFLKSVHEKEVIMLSEQDMQNISELVRAVTAIENSIEPWSGMAFVSSFTRTALYYDGTVYGGSNIRSGYFQKLISELVQLSPLSISWHHP